MDFDSFKQSRYEFLQIHHGKDHVVLSGTSSVLLSAPHGVDQVRLGKRKVAEIGSLPTALEIKNNTNCYLIAKTKNNFDDANFDEESKYKTTIDILINSHKITHVIDIHGLAAYRPCDINLGINMGKNIETNPMLLDKFQGMLEEAGFSVSIDQPFSGSGNTVSGYTKRNHPETWSLQIEINCAITNYRKNNKKRIKLIHILENFVNYLSYEIKNNN